jgi:hypothetical protein
VEQAKNDLIDLKARIIHLVQAIDSVERLQRVQAYAVKLLTKDLDTLLEQTASMSAKPAKPAKGKRR